MVISAESVIATSASASPHLSPSLKPRDDRLTNDHGHAYEQTGAFSWPQRFFKRQNISKGWENSPWVKAVLKNSDWITAVVENASEAQSSVEDPVEEDHIFFLRTEENWPADLNRVAPLVAFFQGATLKQLEEGLIDDPTGNIAILIDGNMSQEQVRYRSCPGILSAPRLLEELQKKRYNESSSGVEADCIDAERRLIYVVDLSRWAVLALVGSAPESLYRVLYEFVLNYILSRPSISVHFSTEGPETFALEFSIPYWVWRTSKTLMHDRRIINSDGDCREPMRSSEDVTFLRTLAGSQNDGDNIDAIYMSHISCVITGYDQFRWTGILLCETWYEVEIPGWPTPDNIARYEGDMQDVQDGRGAVELSDPLCRGRDAMFPSTPKMWLPRFYFIRVFATRLDQIYQESMGLFNNVDSRIKSIAKRHRQLLQRMHESARNANAAMGWNDVLDEFDEFEEKMGRAKDTVKKLAQTMEENVSSGDSFMATNVNYFLNLGGRSVEISDCYPYLSQIRRIFNDLQQLRQRFEGLQTQCKDMVEDCVAAKEKALLRVKLNRTQPGVASAPAPTPAPIVVAPNQSIEVRILSWITITSQPLVNTAAVFGCDDIITFRRTPENFLYCLLLMCLSMAAIVLLWTRLATGKWPCLFYFWEPAFKADANPNSGDVPAETIDDPAARSIRRGPTFFTGFMNFWQRHRVNEILPFRIATPPSRSPPIAVELTTTSSRTGADPDERRNPPNQTGSVIRARERP